MSTKTCVRCGAQFTPSDDPDDFYALHFCPEHVVALRASEERQHLISSGALGVACETPEELQRYRAAVRRRAAAGEFGVKS